MSYRDELAAARAQTEKLASELAEARETIAQLKAPSEANRARLPRRRLEMSRHRRPRALGRMHFHPPPSYVPLLRLVLRGPRVVWDRIPHLPPSNGTALSIVARAVVWPFFHLLYIPAYLITLLLVVVPWSFILATIASVLLLPYILLSRTTVSSGPPKEDESSMLYGPPTDDKAASFLFFSVAPVPMLYPFTFAIADW